MSLEKDMMYECSWCGTALEPEQLNSGLCSDLCAEKTYYGDFGQTEPMSQALVDGQWVPAVPHVLVPKWKVILEDLQCIWIDFKKRIFGDGL